MAIDNCQIIQRPRAVSVTRDVDDYLSLCAGAACHIAERRNMNSNVKVGAHVHREFDVTEFRVELTKFDSQCRGMGE